MKSAPATSPTQRIVHRWRYRSALHAARAIHLAGTLGRHGASPELALVPRPRGSSAPPHDGRRA